MTKFGASSENARDVARALRPGPGLLLWHGYLTTRRRLRLEGAALVAGGVAWLILLLALPGAFLVVLAFLSRGPYGQVEWDFTLRNLARLAGFGTFGWSADLLRILLRSVWVALATTAATIALAYPLAFFIAGRPPRRRAVWLTLVMVPFCTNLVIRTYAWMLILSPGLPPARLAQGLGLVPPHAALYPGALATLLGMVSAALPFAVLPLYASVERLDPALVEAARDLYAAPGRVFLRVVLPQTAPGLAVAVLLTFVPAMGMFVVPDLLGGAKYWLIGNVIAQQFGASRDWPFGAAVALALILLTLVGISLVRRHAGPHAEPSGEAADGPAAVGLP